MKKLVLLTILSLTATAQAVPCPNTSDGSECNVAYACQEMIDPAVAAEIEVLEGPAGNFFELYKRTSDGRRYNSGSSSGIRKNLTDTFVEYYYPGATALHIDLATGMSTYTTKDWGAPEKTSNYFCQKPI